MSLKASTIAAPRARAPRLVNSMSFLTASNQVSFGDANEDREAFGARQNVFARRLSLLRCPPSSPSQCSQYFQKIFEAVMFNRPRTKTTGPPPSKKRKLISTIEEIAFDPSAREDYLTGFHKRKLQRIKYAKEEAAKREREEKLAARKIVSTST